MEEEDAFLPISGGSHSSHYCGTNASTGTQPGQRPTKERDSSNPWTTLNARLEPVEPLLALDNGNDQSADGIPGRGLRCFIEAALGRDAGSEGMELYWSHHLLQAEALSIALSPIQDVETRSQIREASELAAKEVQETLRVADLTQQHGEARKSRTLYHELSGQLAKAVATLRVLNEGPIPVEQGARNTSEILLENREDGTSISRPGEGLERFWEQICLDPATESASSSEKYTRLTKASSRSSLFPFSQKRGNSSEQHLWGRHGNVLEEESLELTFIPSALRKDGWSGDKPAAAPPNGIFGGVSLDTGGEDRSEAANSSQPSCVSICRKRRSSRICGKQKTIKCDEPGYRGSVTPVPDKLGHPAANSNRGGSRHRLTPQAKAILEDWLAKNWDYPYPTEKEKESLAFLCGITVTQVNNWMMNVRVRRNRTRKIGTHRALGAQREAAAVSAEATLKAAEPPLLEGTPPGIEDNGGQRLIKAKV
ncbi:unnamed protein product [Discosporangium mesarthrocarpum]